ncbi:MAG TPA: APC family permease, partial [Vicinamibacterales bacterium]|nr:APC family permease [Vicinamibacterales bacterium]
TATTDRPALLRVMGRWDLTATGVNQVIGGAIFAVPAILAAAVGAWSPWLTIVVGFTSLLIAASIAEVASRFEGTGGPYLYTRAAFGRFAAFEVGWLSWVTRVASWASILQVFIATLGFYWPWATSGLPRAVLMIAVVGLITAINYRGIRQSSLAVNLFTVGKLTPLLIFIVVGVWFVDPVRVVPAGVPEFAALSSTALTLVFAFGGYENIPIPAGEARDPRRNMPFALILTLVIVTVVFALVQIVALGTLPTLAASSTPLADSAAVFLGAGGAALMTAAALISVAGNNLGGALAGSRILFALAEQGDVPALFSRIHPRFRTPGPAVLTTSAVTLTLGLTGTFAVLAQVSAISRLIVYVATCSATLRLRDPRFKTVVPAAAFVTPMGAVVPVAAMLCALAILAGATRLNLLAAGAGLAVGAVIYGVFAREAHLQVTLEQK